MFERFTEGARRTVVLAQEEARTLNHGYIGSEHLLAALTADAGPAGKALAAFGVTAADVRTRIEEVIGRGQVPATGHLPFTPRARDTLQSAFRTALQIGHNYIGPEHLLLGLLASETSVSHRVLLRCGTAPSDAKARLLQLMNEDQGRSPAVPDTFILSA